MPVIVVRHAHALSRSKWEGDDAARTLSARGHQQARLLAATLLELKPTRILSSPYVRCVDTVRPLAQAAGLDVELRDELAEGEGRAAVELLRRLAADDNPVLCSHGDVIPDILVTLANEDGVDLGPSPQVQKGSVWLLYGEGGRFSAATYLEPPGA
ncbi:MAG TPA: phosphoglycerate mutase family protein [Acidimicrobiales bacterium]|nr:phosphoglycerate mutase family protein [Acidimicrobiales bacterium]